MRHPIAALSAIVAFTLLECPAPGQPPSWTDPSPHKVQFVAVEPDVRLEVLDWGGTGRPLVLLAGYTTAHAYDDLAPKLAAFSHVYGITRRGYGASSRPEAGYTAARSAADVLAVLDALRLDKPVLAGQSYGGMDLSTLGATHSDRLGGLVYLNSAEDPTLSFPPPPGFKDARPASMKTAPPLDHSSFAAFRASQLRAQGVQFPEAELRATFAVNPDGSVGAYAQPPRIRQAIFEGRVKPEYDRIRVPVLVFFALLPSLEQQFERYKPQTDEERDAVALDRELNMRIRERHKADLLKGVPAARVIDVPGANWYVFLSNHADLFYGIRAFLRELP